MATGLSLSVGVVLLLFAVISAAIIYHIWKYSPDRKSAIFLIFVYLGVSFFFLLLTTISSFSLLG